MSCSASKEECCAHWDDPFDIKQEDIKSEDSCCEVRHSSNGSDQEGTMAPLRRPSPNSGCSSPLCIDQRELDERENEDEEKIEIKIEEEPQNEVPAAQQYTSSISGASHIDALHSIDDIIALGLTLKKEIKEEENELYVNEGSPHLEDEVERKENLLLNSAETGVPDNDFQDESAVTSLIRSSGVPLKPLLTIPESESSWRFKKKGGLNMMESTKNLMLFFDPRDDLFHCDHCEYTTKYPHGIKYHRWTHTGEKPYKCTICHYEASHPTTLRRHMRRHTGEKPHACSYCDYKAAQPIALKNHIRRTHTGEKPYTCDVCQFKAHDLGSLRSHKLTHLNPDQRPYECEICGIKMSRRRHLMRHADRKHPGTKISLEKRFKTTKKSRMVVTISNTNQSRSKNQRRPFKWGKRKKSESMSESSSSQTSDDEMSLPVDETTLKSSSDDQDYHPDRCFTLPTASNLVVRPRRNVVAPKKLDL